MNTIAVIRMGRLGDVVLTAPTIKNLRFLYPESKIVFVTRKTYEPLTKIIPGVSEALTFPDSGTYFDLIALSGKIDECQPDLIVDLHKNFRSFHLANLTKVRYKVVYKKRRKERQAAVSDKKFVSPIPHTTDQYNIVIDILKGERFARRPDLILPQEILWGKGKIREGLALAPGASSPVKTWPAKRFAAIAERVIHDFHLPVKVFLGQDEADLRVFFDHLPKDAVTFYHNAPLIDLPGHLAQCRCTLTNDSGLLHISSAVGTPTLALFGPTHEQLGFYPLGLHDQILSTDEKCRPCSLHGNEPCYREEQYCFNRLTVEQVYGKVAETLEKVKLDPAVFVDRDGTLIEDKQYLADPAKITFLPGSLESIKKLKAAGYKVVIVSNQSGVARGFFPIATVDRIHDRMRQLMEQAGAEPDGIYFCPHYIDGDVPEYSIDCACRKPKAGMLEEAAICLGIDLKRSYIIGDKYSDIQCGRVAGSSAILVRTGSGSKAEKELPTNTYLCPDNIMDSLKEAVDLIISRV